MVTKISLSNVDLRQTDAIVGMTIGQGMQAMNARDWFSDAQANV
jgi:hypothetical protein